MRKSLFLLIVLASGAFTACPATAAQPVYKVLEYPEVTITRLISRNKAISIRFPNGGTQVLSVSAKTWIIKSNNEATFNDLEIGQRVRVRYIPRGALAVTVEVLSRKSDADNE